MEAHVRKAPLVYIAGPYSGANYLEIDRNISRARDAAKWLCDNRLFFFCPHLNSAHFGEFTDAPKEYWYNLDLEIMYGCDALYLLDGWAESKGTLNEIRIAEERGMPVFFPGQVGSLLAWRMKWIIDHTEN